MLFKLLLLFLNYAGINNLFRYLNRNKAMILMYHGICNDDFNLLNDYDPRHVHKSIFKEQLSYLRRKGYHFATMSELIDKLKNCRIIKRHVVLTFDDGFKNVIENAYPIMKDFNGKGCFYLVSSLIDTSQLLWTDYVETVIRNVEKGEFKFIFKGEPINYRLDEQKSYESTMVDIKTKLRTITDKERTEHIKQFHGNRIDNIPKEFILATWEQIKDLDERVLEVGSHTRNHPNCANLISNDEFENEIKNSKTEIEEKVGYEIDHFNYPAGSFNDEVIEKLKIYGYESAVSTIHGFNDENTDLYKLKRIGASGDLLLFKAVTSGVLSGLIRFYQSKLNNSGTLLALIRLMQIIKGKKRA